MEAKITRDWVAGYALRVTGCGVRVAGCALRVAGLSIGDFRFRISDWKKQIYDILWQKFLSQRRKARKDKLKIKTERSDSIIRQ